MDHQSEGLGKYFQMLTDEELLHRYQSRALTPEAQKAAGNELLARGISLPPLPEIPDEGDAQDEFNDLGDLVILTRRGSLPEVQILQARLEAEGIFAVAPDTEIMRTYYPVSILDGARILVREAQLEQALQVIRAINAGQYALDETSDLVEPDS